MVSFKISGIDSVKLSLDKITKKMNSCNSEVGFIDNSIVYDDGVSVPAVAFMQEYGVESNKPGKRWFIPPRPFMSYSSALFSESLSDKFANELTNNGFNSKEAIDSISNDLKDRIETTIVEWSTPPNAAYTVQQKGFNDPLIETHKMLNSVSYKVKSGL